MVNLENHNNHSHCTYYIYATLGINERQGFLYVGQHKCKKKGKFDNWYFGSGFHIKRIEKKYGKDYIKDNFKCIPLWWCETKEDANQMEEYFIAEYETKEIGANIADGGEGYTIGMRQQYWNDKFGNAEFVAYSEEEMDGFVKAYQRANYEAHKEERIAYTRAYRDSNREEILAKAKVYYNEHKEEILAKTKANYKQNKEEILVKNKSYRYAHKEEIKLQKRAYNEAHKEEINAKQRAYNEAHKEYKRAYNKAYYEQNKEEILAKQRAYERERYAKQREEINARRRAKRAEQKKNKPKD